MAVAEPCVPDPSLAERAGIEWRYLPHSEVRHALRKSDDCTAACGLFVLPASMWLGTGSKREYERVAELRPCRSCVKALSR